MKRFIGAAFLLVTGSLFGQTGPGGVGSGAGILELWLDGKDVNGNGTSPANNAAVTTWTDKSGNGKNVTQNTTGVATYSTANSGVVFANNGYLSASDAGLPTGNSPRSLFVLASSTNTAIDDVVFFYGTTADGQSYGLLRRGGSGDIRSFFHGAPDLDDADGWDVTTPVLINTTVSGNAHRIYLNGTQTATQTRTATTNLGEGIQIGGWASYGGLHSEATIKEVILFSSALNNAQKAIVENYLSAKYNVALTSTDFYSGVTYINGVQGIGTSDGTAANTHSQSTNSGGLELETSGTTFNAANEYVFTGYLSTTNSVVTTNLPATALQRWERIWYLDKTGNVDARISFNLSTGGIGGVPSGSNYVLLYRASTTGNFSIVTSTLAVSGSKVTFTVSNANLVDGYYTIGTTAPNVSPLPVIFVDFSAHKENNKTLIKWQTSSETNNASFAVERSADMVTWKTISLIEGADNSSEIYSYNVEDDSPLIGTTYYRIKQTDKSGKYSYTNALSVYFEPHNITIYPNPTQGEIIVKGYFSSVSVFNAMGEIISVPKLLHDNGATLNLSQLPMGIYTVSFEKGNGEYIYQKVVVER